MVHLYYGQSVYQLTRSVRYRNFSSTFFAIRSIDEVARY